MNFTPGAGTWGSHGICPYGSGNTCLFLTQNQNQVKDDYDDILTSEGILRWEGQRSAAFSDRRNQALINHDDSVHDVLLFLRPNNKVDYSYLGRLRYITHDLEREKPIHVQWKLLDLEVADHLDRFRELGIEVDEVSSEVSVSSVSSGMTKVERPVGSARGGVRSREYKARVIDYAARDAANRDVGKAGEIAALSYERDRLLSLGKSELAEKVRHSSVEDGDGLGYDILSFNEDGSELYVEVKSTSNPSGSNDFFISPKELRFLRENELSYKIVRIYGVGSEDVSFFEISGSELVRDFDFEPISFRVRPR